MFISSADSRQSLKAKTRVAWDSLVMASLTVAGSVDPFEKDLPEGTIIRAVDAVDWSVGRQNCDIRPRLVDKSTGISRLLDSGSQISVTRKLPGDKVDHTINLVAVNGTKIKT